ncbi:GSCOCT00013087001.2-RA-CDS [Cotesia congregata]|uniref:Cc_vank.2_15.2 n=1 Tax=Cotesia congregata TaxID=51543 RepID=S6D9K6_COTCN|nr:GSCOCT00013087001.2-RA-CDS [Cotesia congregata]CAG5092509.1 cc_vank.2_15.2 [Cotesia congregata]CCQ71230.1 viral ankyrin VANK-2 [Cotesia congregata]
MGWSGNCVFFDNFDHENIFHCLCCDESNDSLQTMQMLVNNVNSYLLRQYNSCGQQCVHIVASRDTPEAQRKFEFLIRWGADVNSKNKCCGVTPLHIAALTKNYRLANLICQQPGRALDICNVDQKIPWRIAYKLEDRNMMWLLRVHGAQCEVSDVEVDDKI